VEAGKLKKNPICKINIRHVPPEGRDYELTVTPQWIEEQFSDCDMKPVIGNGQIRINVSPVSENYYIKGGISLKFKMTCVRCLKETVISFNVPLSIVMVKESSVNLLPKGKKSDIGVSRFSGDEIVLDEEIRESIVVGLPMNPTCSEGCSVEDLYRD